MNLWVEDRDNFSCPYCEDMEYDCD